MKPLEYLKTQWALESRKEYRDTILSLLEPDRSAQVLDLGCGQSNRLTSAVQNRIGTVYTPWGVDLDDAIDDAVGKVKHDLEEPLPFHNDSFDVVIASQIIEHLKHTDLFLREIHRVLVPGGYAVVSTPNLAAWHNVAYLMLGRQPETAEVSDEMHAWKERPGHLRAFTSTGLLEMLKFHGFQIVDVIGSLYFPFLGGIGRRLAKADWKHAGVITVKARKCLR